ncbi:Uncharacterized protein Rs2_24347 [Raphanus sativus]|nr:Uncharacterized protein Rs2_24347 [Raphanus sativus]
MKRKRHLDKGVSNKEKQPLHPYQNITTAGIRDEHRKDRTARVPRENDSVPLSSIFKRLYEGVSKHQTTISMKKIDEQSYSTPKTARNKPNGFSVLGFSSNGSTYTPEQRSCLTALSSRDVNRGEENGDRVKKDQKHRTTQQPNSISRPIGLFGSIEQQTSTTPKTPANKNKRKIATILPEKRSSVTSITSRDRINAGDNDSHVIISKKRRKNSPAVLKDITNISKTLGNDKGNIKSNRGDDTCEDHDSDDDDADDDCNIDIRGVIEEIDDSLEFDCSSEESSDTESEDTHFDESVEPEKCAPHTEFHKESFIDAKTSTRPTKRVFKNKTGRKDDGKN